MYKRQVLSVEGFRFEPAEKYRLSSGALTAPSNAVVTEEKDVYKRQSDNIVLT